MEAENRDEVEEELAIALLLIWMTFEDSLLNTGAAWASFNIEFNRTVGPIITRVYDRARINLVAEAAKEIPSINEKLSPTGSAIGQNVVGNNYRGLRFAVEEFKRELFQSFQTRKQDFLQRQRMAQPGEVVPNAFDSNAADMISITGVTAIHSKGELDQVKQFEELGIGRMVGVWKLDPRSNWCKVCFNEDGGTTWKERFPNGPPIHPRCACSIDWKFVAE